MAKRRSAGRRRASGGRRRAGGVSARTRWTVVLLVLVFAGVIASMYFVGKRQRREVARTEEKAVRSGGPERTEGDRHAGKGRPEAKGKKERRPASRPGKGFPGLELPLVYDSTFIIVNRPGRYVLNYSPGDKQPLWVAYVLTRRDVSVKGTERENRFTPDPQVLAKGWRTARSEDYARSGYDRGHLLPSADRDDRADENRTTFYFSNLSPQRPALNRGTWNRLEQQVRKWAGRYDSLYVVTGPVLSDPLGTIGTNRVTVPRLFYKAVLVRHKGEWKAVGFLVPNSDRVRADYRKYARSVDALEAETGHDFYFRLPDSVENRAEAEVDTAFWFR